MPFIASTPHRTQRTLRILGAFRLLLLVVGLLSLAGLAGCTPVIGDKCVLSTDCSTRGDRLCDTSQPNGYCTEFNCSDNSCPDEAVCVLFNASLPGCDYNDKSGAYGSRIGRTFCAAKCVNDGDCRAGYVCGDPHAPPWSGIVLDDDQSKRTCLTPPADYGIDAGVLDAAIFTPGPGAPVCSAVGPNVTPIEAGAASIVDGGGPLLPPLVPTSGDSGVVDAGDAGISDAGDAGDGGD